MPCPGPNDLSSYPNHFWTRLSFADAVGAESANSATADASTRMRSFDVMIDLLLTRGFQNIVPNVGRNKFRHKPWRLGKRAPGLNPNPFGDEVFPTDPDDLT